MDLPTRQLASPCIVSHHPKLIAHEIKHGPSAPRRSGRARRHGFNVLRAVDAAPISSEPQSFVAETPSHRLSESGNRGGLDRVCLVSLAEWIGPTQGSASPERHDAKAPDGAWKKFACCKCHAISWFAKHWPLGFSGITKRSISIQLMRSCWDTPYIRASLLIAWAARTSQQVSG